MGIGYCGNIWPIFLLNVFQRLPFNIKCLDEPRLVFLMMYIRSLFISNSVMHVMRLAVLGFTLCIRRKVGLEALLVQLHLHWDPMGVVYQGWPCKGS